MRAHITVISTRFARYLDHLDLALFGETVEISVHRREADTRENLLKPSMEFIGGWVVMGFAQQAKQIPALPRHPFTHRSVQFLCFARLLHVFSSL
jgi:hypothetical protein